MFWIWQVQVTEDPLKSVPLYPDATNIVNTKPEETWALDSHHVSFATYYAAQASDADINDFYDDWLLENGWERLIPTGQQNFVSDDAHGYEKFRNVPTGIKFTGFSGPLFGVPWFRASFDRVTYNLYILLNSSDYPPPGGIAEIPAGSIRVVLAYGTFREFEP
jgi:hypothetical protein